MIDTERQTHDSSHVIYIKNLDEALSFLEKNRGDLCCLDISKDKTAAPPDWESLNGHNTGRLILISDSYDASAQEWLKKLSPGAFLVKPVSRVQLAATVDVVIMAQEARSRSDKLFRRKMNTALRSAEAILSVAPQGFIIADPEGRTVYANQTLAEMMGFSQDEIIGAMPWQLLAPGSISQFREEYAARRRGRGYNTYEISLQGRKSQPFQVVVTALGIYSDSGQLLGSFGRVSPKKTSSKAQKITHSSDLGGAKRSLCILLNTMLPSLLTMKSPERLRTILDFMETFLTSNADQDMWRGINFRGELPLTSMDVALCAMIRSGLTSGQIAEIFGVSPKTVAFHRGNLRKKLGLMGRDQTLTAFLSRANPSAKAKQPFSH